MGRLYYDGQGLNLSHPTTWNWGRRRGRPWSVSDLQCANWLRYGCGMDDAFIGRALGRSADSVTHKLGYRRKRAA